MKSKLLPAALTAIACIAVADLVRTATAPYFGQSGSGDAPAENAAATVLPSDITKVQPREIATDAPAQADDPYSAAAASASETASVTAPEVEAGTTELAVTKALPVKTTPIEAAAAATTAAETAQPGAPVADTATAEAAVAEAALATLPPELPAAPGLPTAHNVATGPSASEAAAAEPTASASPATEPLVNGKLPAESGSLPARAAESTSTTVIAAETGQGIDVTAATPLALRQDEPVASKPALAAIAPGDTVHPGSSNHPAVLIQVSETLAEGTAGAAALASTEPPAVTAASSGLGPISSEVLPPPVAPSTVEN
ncbi:MAG: hypothetical protein JNM89_06015 [Hyphomicrobiaceae bacterium]|nr:hypothetical protein [Hyphomicrobiaceae bacterium]